jgi:hypothetical protein
MPKANRATAIRRTDEVLKILLAGGEYEDIRQYAATKEWKLSERQLRRYMQLAYERLADATNQNLKSLMGRHLMQRRGLYARALKTNDVRSALLALKDEAELEGLYPPTKVAPASPDGLYPYVYEHGPALSREERFKRLLAAEAREDKDELRLLEQVTPIKAYYFPDTAMATLMLNMCALMHVAEVLDYASCIFMATVEGAKCMDDPDRFATWAFIGECHGYRYRVEVDAWELFTESLGVDGLRLIKDNHRGSALELFSEHIYEMCPTREQIVELFKAEGQSTEHLPTAKSSAQEWHCLLNKVLNT